MKRSLLILSLGLTSLLPACGPAEPKAAAAPVAVHAEVAPAPKRVLVFGKAAADQAAALAAQVAAVQKQAQASGLETDVTADAAKFTEANLAGYRAVVFCGTSGAVLNAAQREAFEGFIQSGGGFVGIDAGADAGKWPWYMRMLGGPAAGHPELAKTATVRRAFDGGRAWYTGPALAKPSLADPALAGQVADGIAFAARADDADFHLKPELCRPLDDYFETEELATGLEDPMEIAPLPDGRLLIAERMGAIKLYAPESGIRTIARLSIPSHDLGEGGVLGIATDPDFGQPGNNFIYIYHSLPERSVERLSRYRLQIDNTLDDEVNLLEIKNDRGPGVCHWAGAVRFGPDRNLFVSCGDNTCPFESDSYSPSDERKGHETRDAQRTAGNSNDYRGGILRIRINENGIGYTIPPGNLWPVGTEKTKPEIFIKGCRNPWRFAVDSKTGGVVWGDVGPDAHGPRSGRGPAGYDCFVFAPTAGYYGWPYARGPRDFYTRYDFAAGKSGKSFAEGIANTSPNNTGLRDLPPVRPATVWYTYGGTPQFPEMGSGGRTACASVVYNQEGRPNSFPAWFDHVVIAHEWMRNRFILMKLDDQNQVESFHDWLPRLGFTYPADVAQDKAGNLYLLSFGTSWGGSRAGRLVKVSFTGWSRPPQVKLDTAEKFDGKDAKFEFTAEASSPEGLAMNAHWDFGDGQSSRQDALPKGAFTASHTYAKPGRYPVVLTVTDAKGTPKSRKVMVSAGNTHPQIQVAFAGAPAAFHWGDALKVNVKASDAEDGDISAKAVVTAEFGVPFAKAPLSPRLVGLDPTLAGAELMVANNCIGCHTATDSAAGSPGPAYFRIAERYKNDKDFANHLKDSIRNGSTGRWKESHMAMPSFSQLSAGDIDALAAAIQSLAVPRGVAVPVVNGVVQTPAARPAGVSDKAVLTIRADVADEGANGIAPLSASAQAVLKVEEKK